MIKIAYAVNLLKSDSKKSDTDSAKTCITYIGRAEPNFYCQVRVLSNVNGFALTNLGEM